MPLDIRPLLTFPFWFNVNPPPLLPSFERLFFILYLVALVAAVVLGMFERRAKNHFRRQLLEKVRRQETALGCIGLLLLFFAYERTPFLAMRLWTLLLWVGAGVWVALLLHWAVRMKPRLAKEDAAREEQKKYLPK